MIKVHLSRKLPLAACCLSLTPLLIAQETKEDEDELVELSPFVTTMDSAMGSMPAYSISGTSLRYTAGASSMGATPGGAQDINFVRKLLEAGTIPHSAALTPEGLFSEHDLPIDLGRHADQLLFIQSAAVRASLPTLPDVTHLGQIGFSSGLDATTWKRSPLNIIAVVDKSGSMNGEPLALVRASLRSALENMQAGDQISIVLYGANTHIHLRPTEVNDSTRDLISEKIDGIASAGSTNMEAGLKLGYDLAEKTEPNFAGTTRVMLFTDEQPNVGRTDAESFMHLAEAGSEKGIGLTTIGVGVHFGAELATRISGVRGGNLYFFPDGDEMRKTFREDFDTLITELAYELRMRLRPTKGYKIAGIFGIPNNALKWEGKDLILDVETIFLSRRKGGIYFAIAPEDERIPLAKELDEIAFVELTYIDASSGETIKDKLATQLYPISHEGLLGLRRGHHLIDEVTTIRAALTEIEKNENHEGATALIQSLNERLRLSQDTALSPELELVANLQSAMKKKTAFLNTPVDPITGLPISRDND